MSSYTDAKSNYVRLTDENGATIDQHNPFYVAPIPHSTGTANNLANNATIAQGANTSSVDISDMNYANVLYKDSQTSSADSVQVQVSVDGGSTWYTLQTIYPTTEGSIRVGSINGMSVHGIDDIRIRNPSSSHDNTNVYCTVVGAD